MNKGNIVQKDLENSNLMQDIAKKGIDILANFNPSEFIFDSFKHYANFYTDTIEFSNILGKNSHKIFNAQFSYLNEAMNLLNKQFNSWLTGEHIEIDHPRFKNPGWVNNPFFNMLSQQYILATKHLNNLNESLEFEDPKLKKRINFFLKQYLEAISPENFLHTNPEIINLTIEQQGKNLLQGFLNFLNDIDIDSARLIHKMTDLKAFKIGKNIAATKGKVIYQNELIELIQYAPQTEKVYEIPLLIIPPWINKYYILDLSKHNSLVQWLVQQGITVFMISWVNPQKEHANVNFFDYLDKGAIKSCEIIQKQLKVDKVNTMGFCIGGTLLAMLLGYLKNDTKINSATFLATLIDFQDPGDIGIFIDEDQIKLIEEKMEKKGFLDGRTMNLFFNSLKSRDLIWSFFINHYLKGKEPLPFDILFWNSDSTNMPKAMHSEYLRKLYLQNNLIKPNEFKLNKTPINLQEITTPVFFIATQKDHIAPWKSVYKGFQLFAGEKHFILGDSGHIAGIINPPNAKKYSYNYHGSINMCADDWLKQAKNFPGSWWGQWFNWLKQKSGKLITAKNMPDLQYPGIRNAPGAYVKQKC